MPMRFRRSVKIAPGVRLNVGKKGISSVSFGGRGARYTVGTGGRRTQSIGIPGTGVSSITTTGQRTRRSAAPPPLPAPPKPGLFAKTVEKRFYKGLEAYRRGDWTNAIRGFEQASAANPEAPSPYLLGAIVAIAQDDYVRATNWLEWLVQNAQLPDELMMKYAPDITVPVPITERVMIRAPLESLGPPLLLAELYQHAGRREEAIGLMQQLNEVRPGDLAIMLSLADLLFEAGDDEGVIEVATGVTNDSDLSLALLHLKAKALLRSGMGSAATSEFTACLRKTSGRDAELLREIRYDRASAYEQVGQKAKARADWEKLYAEDPTFADVKDRVRAQ